MKRLIIICFVAICVFGAMPDSASSQDMKNYGNITLTGGFQAGHFLEWWDLTENDLVVSFTYNANGLVDDSGAHAWGDWVFVQPVMETSIQHMGQKDQEFGSQQIMNGQQTHLTQIQQVHQFWITMISSSYKKPGKRRSRL